MGDFLGFTFGGVHSSDLGITRVSGGDRYDEELHPEIKDRTAEVPGVNGDYYFGSNFGPRTIDIEFAFDHVTEKQFRQIRRVFGTKHMQRLVFDERPYKYYMAKIESPVELSYICFDEQIRRKFSEKYDVGTVDPETGLSVGEQGVLTPLPEGVRMVDDGQGNRVRQRVDPWVYEEETERIYKGEGKISFICHFPFAKSMFKVLPSEGSEEWAVSSGILSAEQYANVDKLQNGIITVYNPGDVPTGFRLYCPFTAAAQPTESEVEPSESEVEAAPSTSAITLTYKYDNSTILAILKLKPMFAKPYSYDANEQPLYDIGVVIDTNTGLVNGVIPQTVQQGTIIYDSETYQLVEASQTTENIGITYDQDGNASYTISGNLYNEYVEAGYFFKFDTNEIFDTTEINYNSTLMVEGASEGTQIFYDYLYF